MIGCELRWDTAQLLRRTIIKGKKERKGEFDFLSQAQVRRYRDVTEVLRQMPGLKRGVTSAVPARKTRVERVKWGILATWRI